MPKQLTEIFGSFEVSDSQTSRKGNFPKSKAKAHYCTPLVSIVKDTSYRYASLIRIEKHCLLENEYFLPVTNVQ